MDLWSLLQFLPPVSLFVFIFILHSVTHGNLGVLKKISSLFPKLPLLIVYYHRNNNVMVVYDHVTYRFMLCDIWFLVISIFE